MRQPIYSSISREGLSASLQLPSLLPGINFYIPGRMPLFRFIAVLGVVPDMVYTPLGYQPANMSTQLRHVSDETAWAPTAVGIPAQSLELKLPDNTGFDASSSLMLSLGIEFGMPLSDTLVSTIKNAGCAKILAMA